MYDNAAKVPSPRCRCRPTSKRKFATARDEVTKAQVALAKTIESGNTVSEWLAGPLTLSTLT
jgi:hypothetical protein